MAPTSLDVPRDGEFEGLDLEPPLEDFFECDEIPETGPVYVQDGKITVSPAPKYRSWQETVLASMGISAVSAELAGIRFEGKTPRAEARISGGLYHPPELVLNLSTSDRLVVAASALEAISGDAHALACTALAGPFSGLPAGLLPMLGDRVLILLRDSGKGPGNQALRYLEKAVREASPTTTILDNSCPSAKALGMTWAEDAEEPVVRLGKWIKSRGIGAVNSTFSRAIRDEKNPLRAAGGYDALGFRGKECIVFSRSRDVIVPLSRADLKDEMALAMAVGASYLENNHTRPNDKGGKSIDAKSLGMEIIRACEPLDAFDGKNVFGAGVWRNSAGNLVVNSRKSFLLDGTPAKRVDGRDIYVAARDLGITPETVPATAAEARKAFEFIDGYAFETKGGALLSFGGTMHSYTCGANDVRPTIFEHGLPGGGKTTVCNFKKALLGEACDHLVGTTEAYLRGMNQTNALALFIDGTDEGEVNPVESRKVFNFVHKGYSGGNDGKGSAPGHDGPVNYKIRSSVHLVANKLPDLTGADISRIVFIKYGITDRDSFKPSDLVPNPRALRFPEVEALGKKLFMRMLLADKRNRYNQKIIENCIATKSVRALMTIAPAIASAFTALHDEPLDKKAGMAWLENFDIVEAVRDIEEAQSGKRIIDHLAHKPAPRPIGADYFTVSKIWEMADHGDKKAEAALAVMGMSVHHSKNPGCIEVRLFPMRQGLRDLFAGSDWAKGNLGKMLCDDPRTSSKQSDTKARLAVEGGVGQESTRTAGERYITLSWEIKDRADEDVRDRKARLNAKLVALKVQAEAALTELESIELEELNNPVVKIVIAPAGVSVASSFAAAKNAAKDAKDAKDFRVLSSIGAAPINY